MTRTSERGRDAPDIARLVRGAAEGDRRAWERLVDQYARLIWSITADFKLIESDAADVAQTTWLRLFEHIDRIEYPDRVGSWLAATARNECLRSLAARKRVVLAHDDEVLTGVVAASPEVDERILADERDQVVRDALSHLPGRWQRLLELLMADPPASYADISSELDLPVGQHRPHPGTVPRPATRPAAGLMSQASRHLPTGRQPPRLPGKASRTSASRSGTNSSTASGRRTASSGRVGHRNVSSRHPQPLLGRRGVDHCGQEDAIHVRLAQQGDRPRRRAIAENRLAGGPFGRQPVVQGLSMSPDIPAGGPRRCQDRGHR